MERREIPRLKLSTRIWCICCRYLQIAYDRKNMNVLPRTVCPAHQVSHGEYSFIKPIDVVVSKQQKNFSFHQCDEPTALRQENASVAFMTTSGLSTAASGRAPSIIHRVSRRCCRPHTGEIAAEKGQCTATPGNSNTNYTAHYAAIRLIHTRLTCAYPTSLT
jgi:hypothetical protein